MKIRKFVSSLSRFASLSRCITGNRPSLAILVLLAAGVAPFAVLAAGSASVVTNGTEVTIDVSGGASELYLSDLYGSEITKVIKTGKDVVQYAPKSPASYGALEIQGGQFRIYRGDSLGASNVLIDGVDETTSTPAALVTFGESYALTNKLIFGAHGYLIPIGKPPIVTSVGSTQDEGSRVIRLGRTGGGVSAATVSLTGADSEPIDRISVRGTFGLTFNGGTLKIASAAASPFLYDIDDGAYAKTATIAHDGLTVDVASGADVDFGPTPVFKSCLVTNCVEIWQPSNYSFESDSTDWTITSNTNVTDESSGIRANGSPFDKQGDISWPTTNGTKYAMIRRTGSLSRKVTLPTNGLWRMTFEMGCRPLDSYSWNIETTVKIDESVVLTIPAFASSVGKHPFQRYETVIGELAAGEHQISVELSDSSSHYASLNFDCFQFERFETNVETPHLTKTGDGSISLSGIALSGNIGIAAGTLKIVSPKIDSNSVVSVATGATLQLSDLRDSIVKNGSFESQVLNENAYQWGDPPDWTRTLTDNTDYYANANGNGYQSNGSAFSGTRTAPDGKQTAYMRNYTKYEQTLNDVTAGVYRLTFAQCPRSGYDSHLIRTSAKIDGVEVLSAGPVAKGDNTFVYHTALVNLTNGDHTLSFDTTGEVRQNGAVALIDDVRLELIEECSILGEVRMEAGSTLILDNSRKVLIDRFFVDGREVSGGRAAIVRAGVNVSGEGQIHVGGHQGLLLIVR